MCGCSPLGWLMDHETVIRRVEVEDKDAPLLLAKQTSSNPHGRNPWNMVKLYILEMIGTRLLI